MIFSFLLTIPLYSDVSNEIAKLYLTTANSFFEKDELLETEAYLSKAVMYNNELSDIHFINSLINTRHDGDLNRSIAYLRRAITSRDWVVYREDIAFFELGRLYSRIKDYKRSLALLYVIKDQFINDDEFLNLYTLSLINTGDFKSAQEYLTYAVSKHPDNDLFITRLAGLDITFRDLLLSRVLDQNNLYQYSPEVILELLRLYQDKGVKRDLILLAERAGNNSIELLFERIAAAGRTTLNDVVLFNNLNGFADYGNIRRFNSATTDRDVSAFFREYFSLYTGHIKEDTNNDGIYERIMAVENGIPVWYSEDENQDNVNNLFVAFQNSTPAFINIEENMLVVFYQYPFVKTVILYDTNEIYNFRNTRTRFDILEFSNPFLPPALKDINIPELFTGIKRYVDTIVRNDSGDILLRYFKTENITNFQSYDQINSIARRGVSRNNMTVYRESDFNRDDVFETREIYRDGVLFAIKFDGNNNGIFEFKVENGVKYWDFDEDGIYDAKEWYESGIMYREFATNMDGIFNFAAKYENGILLEVRRNNEWRKVYYDKSNNIYWIGERRININTSANLESGAYIFSGNNKAYIIRVGNDFFAEVIN